MKLLSIINGLCIKLIIFSFMIVLFKGCPDSNPPEPLPPDGIVADINGFVTHSFKAYPFLGENNMADRIQLYFSGISKAGDIEYDIIISIYYMDKQVKTGTFDFHPTFNASKYNFALGAFTILNNGKQRNFWSDSGSVTITEKNGFVVKGFFNFTATDSTKTTKVEVTNGVLNLK
ncbi:MAG: hypothetical protein WCT77_11790 [Bacteroidota bacterium]